MPIRYDVWNDLIGFEPGHRKNRGSLAARWGDDSIVESLIEAGHLKFEGGRVSRTKTSVDAAALWAVLPDDGTALGNQRARTELGWKSERRYEAAKALLIATEEVAVGRGRGGSLRRTSSGGVTATTASATPRTPREAAAAIPAPATAQKSTRAANSLEKTLWDAADKLRGKMDAAVFKHVVLGLIFLKYVSDTFMVRHDELARLVDDPQSEYSMPNDAAKRSVLEDRDEYTAEGVFWIPEGHRWEDLRSAGKQPDIGKRVDAAMDAIERENPTLKGVLPKNYTQRELSPETIGGLIDTFSRQDLAAEEFTDLDVLGRVYEYFLGQFASKEGKKAGEFYTPRSIVQLLVEMLQPYKGRVLDPACGSGGMFVQADKFVRAHGGTRDDLSVFGQESNPTTWRLAKMNLALRGIDGNLGPEWGDSFHADAHPDLKADFIIANPPFNISDWGGERLRQDVRWKYGVPPQQNANYAWLQHMLYHLAPTGTVASLLANGSLSSKQNGEGEIRKAMIEGDVVECIVALPPQLFYGVQIPCCAWFLTNNKRADLNGATTRRREGETLFIDASQIGFMENRTHRAFSDVDILKIADTYHAWRGSETSGRREYADIPGFCRAVTTAKIAEDDYVLTPGRYVGSQAAEVDDEPLKGRIARLSTEIRDGFRRREELQATVLEALDALRPTDE
ncbi:class I SAM-dependent DNA methyltransferase [Fodinibacter luteus]|uniref:site-specific DNA-methyltransferase (adenine-specific) n=1 Tax=Fodinibacter luteus TaxID=552064 RepID=A0ABP8KN38_9MICO